MRTDERRTWSRTGLLALALLVASPAPAAGQASKPKPKVTQASCKVLYKEKKLQEALGCWQSLVATSPDPENRVWVAFMLDKLGQYKAAWAENSALATIPVNGATSTKNRDAIATAQKNLLVVERKLAVFRVTAPTARELSISIDGATATTTPAGDVLLEPGSYKVDVFQAAAPSGTKPLWTRQLDAKAGERYHIELGAEPPAPALAPPPAPCTSFSSYPSKAQVPPPAPRPTPTALTTTSAAPLKLGLAGLGLAGLSAGAVLGVLSLQTRGDLLARCSGSACPPEGEPLKENAVILGTASTVALSVGLAGLGAALVLYATAPVKTSSPRATIGVGPRSIQVRGAF